MTKTQEEQNQLKIEQEMLTTKLKELNENELKQVSGGASPDGQSSDEDMQNALKRAEEALLAKKQEQDTTVIR